MTATKKLSLNHVARIEGHGNVHIDVTDGTVELVEMNITEAARFFEAMVLGRTYREVPYISSRICGICSASHVVTSLLAIEAAFGVEVSERTRLLRQLLVYGSYLQNHATHLYILAAPDYVGEASILPLAQSAPDIFARALRIKQLGNELCTCVGGRSIHPISAVVGGFTREPAAEDFISFAERLEALADDCAATSDLIASFEAPDLTTAGDLLALKREGAYAIVSGQTAAVRAGWTREPSDYRLFIKERTVEHSNAKFSYLEDGSTYMVGALARMNLSWKDLTDSARFIAAKAGIRPTCLNPYRNNLCQAIELVDAAERCAALCRLLAKGEGSSEPVGFQPCSGEGVGATEAPRGTVYHRLSFDERGMVTGADILTPTAQSLANLESDLRILVPSIIDESPERFVMFVEELVRAYDPCLSCAVH